MRQIYPVQGPDWTVMPKVAAGPVPDAVADLARLYADQAEPSAAGRPWVRANMVTSTDGAATLDGVSGGLSGPADRMVFTVLRSLADVILVGAGTVRAERYRPVSEAGIWTALRPTGAALPAIAVVTGSLDLDSFPQLLTGEQPIMITTAAAADDAARAAAAAGRVKLIVAGQQRVDGRQAMTALSGLGYQQILVEGGPSLLSQLVDADLLDELCVTISPVLVGGTAGRIVSPGPAGHSAPTSMALAHVLADDNFLLCRYLRLLSTVSREE